VLKWIISCVEMPVWWPMILREITVCLIFLQVSSNMLPEVKIGEESVSWDTVVSGCRFIVISMLEECGV